MYGLNNNTGFTYSQQDNNLAKMNRSTNSTNFGESLKKSMSLIEDLENLQKSNNGGQRMKTMAAMAAKIAGGLG